MHGFAFLVGSMGTVSTTMHVRLWYAAEQRGLHRTLRISTGSHAAPWASFALQRWVDARSEPVSITNGGGLTKALLEIPMAARCGRWASRRRTIRLLIFALPVRSYSRRLRRRIPGRIPGQWHSRVLEPSKRYTPPQRRHVSLLNTSALVLRGHSPTIRGLGPNLISRTPTPPSAKRLSRPAERSMTAPWLRTVFDY